MVHATRIDLQSTGGSTPLEVNFLHTVAVSNNAQLMVCSLPRDKQRGMAKGLAPRGKVFKELMSIPDVTSVHSFPANDKTRKHLMLSKE